VPRKGRNINFREFITEEMCGKNGFYNTHRDFGKTIVNKCLAAGNLLIFARKTLSINRESWFRRTALYGKEVLKLAKKRKVKLNWTGIEINGLVEEIQKNKPQNFVSFKISCGAKSTKNLTIFAYSLDSMPNEVIVNNAMLGVKIANGIWKKFLLSENNLKRRGILFKDGIFRTKNYTF